MIVCSRCGSVELRVHAGLQRVVWEKRHWWGPVVPRGTTVAVEVSCGNCLYAFVARPDGSFTSAPLQAAHDALMQAQKKLAEKDRNTPDGERPVPRSNHPRPAADPRVKRSR